MSQKHYQVVAIPAQQFPLVDDNQNNDDDDDNDENDDWRDFCELVKRQIAQLNHHHHDSSSSSSLGYSVTVDQWSRVMDPDDGDCFLAGIQWDPAADELPKVEEWLHPSAEVWVSGSESLPMAPPMGWKVNDFVVAANDDDDSTKASTTTRTTACVDLLRKYGLAIVRRSATSSQQQAAVCSHAISLLHEYVAMLEQTVREHHPHIALGKSAFGFAEYTHRGPGRFEVLFPPDHELCTLLRTAWEPRWQTTVLAYLRAPSWDRVRCAVSCVYSRPGSVDQDWHTDGGHYPPSGGGSDDTSTCPYALCIFVPLVPLTEATGYTRFWPRSHWSPQLLGLAQAADVCLQAHVNGMPLQAGDYVLYDYTTWHKGIANTTADVERPMVQFLYSWDWYKEKRNYGEHSVFDAVDGAK